MYIFISIYSSVFKFTFLISEKQKNQNQVKLITVKLIFSIFTDINIKFNNLKINLKIIGRQYHFKLW